VEKTTVEFAAINEIHAGPLNGVNLIRAMSSLVKMTMGVMQSVKLINQHQPQSILLTGGWANVPLAIAAWLMRVPVAVYLPDIEPGRTIQLLRLFAKKVAITVDESAKYFKAGQTVVTGYPLRESVTQANRETAIEHFDLDTIRKTLLVSGGSRGARSINIALGNILPDLLRENLQIIHVTGSVDWERMREQTANLPDKAYYHPYEYLHDEMGLAFAAADLVICRSGASTLGELPAFGLPAILVPYPYAWRYQKTNADYLANRGAAIRLDDDKMDAELLTLIKDLLNQPNKLDDMQQSARVLAHDEGAQNIAQLLIELAEGRS